MLVGSNATRTQSTERANVPPGWAKRRNVAFPDSASIHDVLFDLIERFGLNLTHSLAR